MTGEVVTSKLTVSAGRVRLEGKDHPSIVFDFRLEDGTGITPLVFPLSGRAQSKVIADLVTRAGTAACKALEDEERDARAEQLSAPAEPVLCSSCSRRIFGEVALIGICRECDPDAELPGPSVEPKPRRKGKRAR